MNNNKKNPNCSTISCDISVNSSHDGSNKLLCNDNVLVLSAKIAFVLGSSDAAVVLQQLHYWLLKEGGKMVDGVHWIYNTYEQWIEQCFWISKWRIRQVLYELRELGVVKFAQLDKSQYKRRGYYTIDYERLQELCDEASTQLAKKFPPKPRKAYAARCAENQHIDVRTAHTSQLQKISFQEDLLTNNTHPPHPAAVEKKFEEKEEEFWQEAMMGDAPEKVLLKEKQINSEKNKNDEENPIVVEKLEKVALKEEEINSEENKIAQENPTVVSKFQKPVLKKKQAKAKTTKNKPNQSEANKVAEDEPAVHAEQQEKLQLVGGVGIRLNAQLAALVKKFALENVKNAIAYYLKTKQIKENQGKAIQRPAGWLTDCLRNSWWQSEINEHTAKENEFKEWYAQAIAAGIVEDIPISWLSKDYNNQYLVRQPIESPYGAPYTLTPWQELLCLASEPKPTTEPERTKEKTNNNDDFEEPY